MLHHPFVHLEDLLSIDGIAYTCYQEAFAACCQMHTHLEDYYVDPEPDNGESDLDDDEDTDDVEADPEIEVPLVDFEAYAQWRPNHDLTRLDGSNGLGTRHLDRAYDWSSYVGKYEVDLESWGQLKAENQIEQSVDVDSSPRTLNFEQRKLYSIVVN
jgi:hypothetical protein